MTSWPQWPAPKAWIFDSEIHYKKKLKPYLSGQWSFIQGFFFYQLLITNTTAEELVIWHFMKYSSELKFSKFCQDIRTLKRFGKFLLIVLFLCHWFFGWQNIIDFKSPIFVITKNGLISEGFSLRLKFSKKSGKSLSWAPKENMLRIVIRHLFFWDFLRLNHLDNLPILPVMYIFVK